MTHRIHSHTDAPSIDLHEFRASDPIDLRVLEDILLLAAYWRADSDQPSRETALNRPDLRYLLSEWGRPGDTAIFAKQGDLVLGASWFRYWTEELHSYGYLDPDIPELAIGVQEEHRRKGLGHQLLDALIGAARAQLIQGLSLSVEQENPARLLYESAGFRIHHQEGNALTMFIELKPELEIEDWIEIQSKPDPICKPSYNRPAR